MMPAQPKEIIFFEDKKGKKPFLTWLEGLDSVNRNRINQRIIRLSIGNYGDFKVLQQNIYELRFTFGPGYRVYFAETTKTNKLVVLLTGGDKKTQRKDIAKAIDYWQEYKESNYD